MRVLHAYCAAQHRSAVLPVLRELEARGHTVLEVALHSGTLLPREGQPDVRGFNQHVFLTSYPHILRTGTGIRYAHQEGIKVCIEHGVNPVAWAFPLDRHELYDLLCLAGPWQRDALARYPGRKPLAELTGWPKVDHLATATDAQRFLARKALEWRQCCAFVSGHPVVAFVPTHGASWRLADALMALGLPNLVVAPHEGRYQDFRGETGTLTFDYRRYPWYVETDDIHAVLLAADLVISDYSSAMLEALVLELPVLQLLVDVPLHNRPRARPTVDGYYTLSQRDARRFQVGPSLVDVSQVPAELDRLVSDTTYYAAERKYWRDEIFYGIGGATARCCDAMEQAYA